MKIPENYRRPAIFAVILHAILLCVLIFSFAASMFRMPPSSSPAKTLHAVAVTESSVQTEVHQTQQQQKSAIEAQEKQEKMEKQQQIEKQEEIVKQQQIEKQKVIEKQHQLALLKTEQLEKIQAEIKAKKLKALKEAEAKAASQAKAQKLKALAKAQKQKVLEEARAKTNALAAEQKKLQQQLMQQQMNSEQKNISAVVTQAQQGAIDKYKAEILAAIQSNWHIDQINSQLKCVYSVDLAPDGSVLSLKLIQSSGDAALDQSAQQAITLASPLPVPHDPALFNHFRQLVLTLSPQGILQSVGND